jgi:hypothetical protein
MQLAPRHLVAIVASVCAAVVLAPVGVMAATGSFVNITDPFSSARRARVGADGTLWAETRAGVTSHAFNISANNVVGLSTRKLTEAAAPNRLAITEITAATRGTENGNPLQVDLIAAVRTSGTEACGGTGWTRTLLRRFSVKTNETVQLLFDGPPLILPSPAAGQRVCLLALVTFYPSGVVLDLGGTGYTYTA